MLTLTKGWDQYVAGFGSVLGDHWLGLQVIHTLCPPSKPCGLRVDMKDPYFQNGKLVWAEYAAFSIEGFTGNYRLSLSGYNSSSTAGDAMLYPGRFRNQNNMAFSTHDRDNDKVSLRNCAASYHGGWWYSGCGAARLNSEFGLRDYVTGVSWYGHPVDTKFYPNYTEMKVRLHV